MKITDAVARELERHKMLRFGTRIGVAVSGGADSVFLLHVLAELRLAAIILHVNHKLRGPDSDADEAFVHSLPLPCHVAILPIAEGNVEQEARRLRYSFFEQCIAEGICDAVATGHTLDDQAETVLYRFLRGSGTAGLSGVRPVTDRRIIRPLLAVRRDEIRQHLTAHNIRWQEDCTNIDTGFMRNRIRLEAMPQLAAYNPGLSLVLASTAEWAQAEEDYWSAEIAKIESGVLSVESSGGIDAVLVRIENLNRYSLALQRRFLRRAVERVKGSTRAIGFQHIEAVRELTQMVEGSGRVQLPGIDAYRSFNWLRLTPPGFDTRLERNFEVPLAAPGLAELPSRGLRVALEPLQMELVNGTRVYNKQVNMLDGEQCQGALTLRNWQPGDSYTPANRSSREKIKTLFQEHRVPLWERRNWPVIAKGNSILWTRGFGAAAESIAGPHSISAFEVRESGESIRTLATSEVM